MSHRLLWDLCLALQSGCGGQPRKPRGKGIAWLRVPSLITALRSALCARETRLEQVQGGKNASRSVPCKPPVIICSYVPPRVASRASHEAASPRVCRLSSMGSFSSFYFWGRDEAEVVSVMERTQEAPEPKLWVLWGRSLQSLQSFGCYGDEVLAEPPGVPTCRSCVHRPGPKLQTQQIDKLCVQCKACFC